MIKVTKSSSQGEIYIFFHQAAIKVSIFIKKEKCKLRFESRISKKGIIRLPSEHELAGKEVEIIILPKQEDKFNKNAAADFVNKWAGILSGVNEDAKYQLQIENTNKLGI